MPLALGCVNFRRVFLLAGTSALVIVYAVLWVRMITDPQQRTGSDFIALYAAGRVVRTDGFSKVYDTSLQQSVQEQQVGFLLIPGQVLLYNHVPFLVPIIALVSGEGYVLSFILWVLILLGVFLVAVTLLASLFRRGGWRMTGTRSAWIGMLLFFPLFISLMNGQDTAFTTLGLCLWLFGLLTGRLWLAGLGLSLVTVRPHIAAFLALPFLFRYRRVFTWFCVGTAVLGLASLLMLGWEGARGFLDLLFLSAGGEAYGLKESAMVNLVGALTRLLPGVDSQLLRWIGWGAYFAALVALCMIWIRNRSLDERHCGLAVVLALFFAPHLHYHDLALLLVPLACLMLFWVRKRQAGQQNTALLPLALSLFLILGSLVPILKYNLPYVVMIIFIIALWFPGIFVTWRSKAHEIHP